MGSALGNWPNAPLIYVLAQVRYNRIPKMDQHWEQIHQILFDLYPRSSGTEQIAEIEISDNGVVESKGKELRWQLLTADRRAGVILAPDFLVYHTTAYETSEAFFEQFKKILEAFQQIFKSSVIVDRIGLRYVDLLLELEDLPVSKQIVDSFQLPDLNAHKCDAVRMDQSIVYKTIVDEKENIGGQLIVRHRQSLGMDLLPGDLFPNRLEPAPLLKREKPQNTFGGLLDYDHVAHVDMPFNAQPILDLMHKLQSATSGAFKFTTTQQAQELWEKE